MNEELFNKASEADFSKILINKGYAYFNKGKYNLNIIGIRNAGNNVTNKFDDVIVVEYIDMYGIKSRNIFAATTDPGITSMTKPVSYKGCAILVPGQYRSAWKLGYHKGKYEAIVQYKPVKVYRDNNGENKLPGICYRLLNATKAGNKKELMDTVIRIYMSAQKEIPYLFLDIIKESKLDYEEISHSFIAGLNSKERESKEEK